MKEYLKTEGIVIRTTPYRERDHVAVVFTRDHGLVSLFVSRSPSFCAPLHKVEIIYSEGKGELCRCKEMSLLGSFLGLRSQLTFLDAACDLLKAIQASQLEGKAAPLLYGLLLCYLDRVADFNSLAALGASFRLKILRHDGLLSFPLSEIIFPLSAVEEEILETLALSRHVPTLASLAVSEELMLRVRQFFMRSIEKEVAF